MRIFVVDDDALLRMIILEELNDPSDTVREFADGKPMLEAVAEGDVPDLILLDIDMPDLDGITACLTLHEQGHNQIQVVFISSHDDLETRMTAYAAGGSDYLVKPPSFEDINAKVAVARRYHEAKTNLSSSIQFAQQTAFTAMSSMGELGVVLQFLRNSFACVDADAVAHLMFESLGQYGLEGMLELRGTEARYTRYYASHGVCTPLQESVLTHARKMERVFRFRSQLSIHYPLAALVIVNLPDDEDRVGRLRDHLAILVEGADARIKALNTEQHQAEQGQGIHLALAELTQTLQDIEQTQAESRIRAMDIDVKFLEQLISAFTSLGLTDSQEETLANMARDTHVQLAELRDIDTTAGERLQGIRKRLSDLIKAPCS
jgi:CheY-like chemotaxis protein